MKIHILLTAYTTNKKQEAMTQRCIKSLVSKEHELIIHKDEDKYTDKLVGSWNKYFDMMRDTDYNYIIWIPNDLEAAPNAIDDLVRFMEENKDIAIGSNQVVRDYKEFIEKKDTFKYKKRKVGMRDMETTNPIFRKGVIEKVGRVDALFPLEFIERDYFYRASLAGFKLAGNLTTGFYHPVESGTIGNDGERLNKALKRYIAKWGGDAFKEQFIFPLNNASLDYTYCML